jgi:hypothetical protein
MRRLVRRLNIFVSYKFLIPLIELRIVRFIEREV